ncbi:LytR/AlgR family response regulator transcription factor [Winogradskyella litorisediminis]|uniref:LytR/AlgR family response regulator transcription factor n=1 Tax=Winogradskyella litorisediminis TaxID=1156618 RepID=A0ABW3N9V7_9FLAO
MAKKVNCIIVDDEAIARDIVALHLQKIERINVIAKCKNAIEAFNTISQHEIDLIFLDINMPEISGIAFAKSINKNVKVIFTTAYRDYAVEGFDLQAVDYVLKPISFERLLKAVNRYFEVSNSNITEAVSNSENSDFIFVRADRQMQKIDFDNIIYIESYSDYIKIHCRDKTIVTRETISNIEVKLPQQQFLRIHRSYIVAITKIRSFSNESVRLNDKELTISRSYKSKVLNFLQAL